MADSADKINLDDLEIVQNTDTSQFELKLDANSTAIVEYQIAGKNIIFTHTEVPQKYEGKGIASRLARHVLDYAVAEGFKIQALCPYIAMYVARHPEYQEHTWGY